MFDIKVIIQQLQKLNRTAQNEHLAQVITDFKKIENSSRAVIDGQVVTVRKTLDDLLTKTNPVNKKQQQLRKLYYDAVIILATSFPRNEIEDVSLLPLDPIHEVGISKQNQIILSCGYYYNIITLKEWIDSPRNTEKKTNPFLAKPFAPEDLERINALAANRSITHNAPRPLYEQVGADDIHLVDGMLQREREKCVNRFYRGFFSLMDQIGVPIVSLWQRVTGSHRGLHYLLRANERATYHPAQPVIAQPAPAPQPQEPRRSFDEAPGEGVDPDLELALYMSQLMADPNFDPDNLQNILGPDRQGTATRLAAFIALQQSALRGQPANRDDQRRPRTYSNRS